MGWKTIVRRSARLALHHSGALNVLRWHHRRKLRILCYHRFTGFDGCQGMNFSEQCAHIRDTYQPLSLSAAVDCLNQGIPLPESAVVITVDDGYRDFYTMAFPILQRHGIPATVYLIGDFLEHQEWLWWNVAEYCMRRTALRSLLLPDGTRLEWRDSFSNEQACLRLLAALKQLPNIQMREVVAALPVELHVDLPAQLPEEYAPISWDEARFLRQHGIEFGAHTMTHPILTRLETDEERAWEISGSKRLIEERLGEEVRHFCYPNGDYDTAALRHVNEAGFTSAVTCQTRMVAVPAARHELPRLLADAVLPAPYLIEMLAGITK